MRDSVKHITIKINKIEFGIISEIISEESIPINYNQISGDMYLLLFDNIDQVLEINNLIKDKSVYRGFDRDYNLNKFRKICEDDIDKFYKI